MRTLGAPTVASRVGPYRVQLLFLLGVAGAVGAVLLGFIAASGRALLAIGAVAAVAGFVLATRHATAVIAMWILAAPFLASAPNPALRRGFWLVHRMLPPLAIVLVVLAAVGIGRVSTAKRMGRLGLVEWMMLGYLFVTVLSVLYTSNATIPTLYRVYDRVFIPMCLYLLIVLLAPDASLIRKFIPFIAAAAAGQIVLGVISWTAPGMLPGHWVTRAGQRTVGSLGSPGEYTVVLTTGVLLMVHSLAQRVRPNDNFVAKALRLSLFLVIVVGTVMVAFTFSRASWFAALVVIVGLWYLNRRVAKRVMVALAAVLVVAVAVGALGDQLDLAARRFQSESSAQSALSRLPVAVASMRMFQERPLEGWGYGNFDLVDREFQEEVAGFFPQKDHVSHNVYLTIAAEQGAVGVLLYLGPLLGAAAISVRAWGRLPREGLVSRRLMVALWLALAVHVIVNNFADAQTAVGPGLWWATLGIVVSLGRRQLEQREELVGPGA